MHTWPRLPGAVVQRSHAVRHVSQVVALMSGDGEYRRPPAEGVGLANEPVRTSHHSARELLYRQRCLS